MWAHVKTRYEVEFKISNHSGEVIATDTLTDDNCRELQKRILRHVASYAKDLPKYKVKFGPIMRLQLDVWTPGK